LFSYRAKSGQTLLNHFIRGTGISLGLTGDDLKAFIEEPDWHFVQVYTESVVNLSNEGIAKTLIRFPE
jgi:hypothetical protein